MPDYNAQIRCVSLRLTPEKATARVGLDDRVRTVKQMKSGRKIGTSVRGEKIPRPRTLSGTHRLYHNHWKDCFAMLKRKPLSYARTVGTISTFVKTTTKLVIEEFENSVNQELLYDKYS